MSPSWRNRLYIAISPARISLLKVGRGLKPKLMAKHDEAISTKANNIVSKQPAWEAALVRLDLLLAQSEWHAPDAEIVLSNSLIRYATITFNNQLKKYPEKEAYARHVLTQTYGAIAGQWELRIQCSKPNTPCLVSAVDKALLEKLRQVCASHNIKLRSVEPYLMPIFNRYKKILMKDPAWLVINEPGGSLLALLSGGEFVALSNIPHDNISELPMLLDRENLIAALPEPCKTVYLHTSVWDELSAMTNTGYEFNKLEKTVHEGFSLPEEGLFAMAMSGAL